MNAEEAHKTYRWEDVTTTLEFALLKGASEGGVWVANANSMEADCASKLAREGELEPVPKHSSTSGVFYKLTDKGFETLKKSEERLRV